MLLLVVGVDAVIADLFSVVGFVDDDEAAVAVFVVNVVFDVSIFNFKVSVAAFAVAGIAFHFLCMSRRRATSTLTTSTSQPAMWKKQNK